MVRVLVLPGLWLIGVIAVIACGFLPNEYLIHVRNILPPHPYPMDTVQAILMLMSVQVLLLMASVRPATYSRSRGRALAALLICLLFLAVGMIGSMHSPPAWGAYTFWLLALALAAIGLLLAPTAVQAPSDR